MSQSRDRVKADLVNILLAAAGEKTPTSSLSRIGRTAFAMMRSGRMIAAGGARRADDDPRDLDLEKLTKVITSIGRLKGIAMKMGQILSYIDMAMPDELRDVIRSKRKLMRFSLPAEFVFLFRIRFGLMSIIARLDARANWYRLEKGYVDDFARAHPLLVK